MAVVVESSSVFVVTFGKRTSGLSYVGLVAVRAGKSVDPEEENLSRGGVFSLSSLSKVLLVRKAIFRSVCLSALVMYSVSLPMYVKVAHLHLVCVSCSCVVLWGWWCLYVGIGNELLCNMLCMTLSSLSNSCLWRLYEFSLL